MAAGRHDNLERQIYYGNVAELANAPDLKSVNPKGYVGSRPTVVVVTMADLAMQRIVVPHYMGSNPISHLYLRLSYNW